MSIYDKSAKVITDKFNTNATFLLLNDVFIVNKDINFISGYINNYRTFLLFSNDTKWPFFLSIKNATDYKSIKNDISFLIDKNGFRYLLVLSVEGIIILNQNNQYIVFKEEHIANNKKFLDSFVKLLSEKNTDLQKVNFDKNIQDINSITTNNNQDDYKTMFSSISSIENNNINSDSFSNDKKEDNSQNEKRKSFFSLFNKAKVNKKAEENIQNKPKAAEPEPEPESDFFIINNIKFKRFKKKSLFNNKLYSYFDFYKADKYEKMIAVPIEEKFEKQSLKTNLKITNAAILSDTIILFYNKESGKLNDINFSFDVLNKNSSEEDFLAKSVFAKWFDNLNILFSSLATRQGDLPSIPTFGNTKIICDSFNVYVKNKENIITSVDNYNYFLNTSIKKYLEKYSNKKVRIGKNDFYKVIKTIHGKLLFDEIHYNTFGLNLFSDIALEPKNYSKNEFVIDYYS